MMAKYKVSQKYTYTIINYEHRRTTMTAEIEAHDEREAKVIAEKRLNNKMYNFVDFDGDEMGEYDPNGDLRIEEIPELSEAQKLELAGYASLFDLQMVK